MFSQILRAIVERRWQRFFLLFITTIVASLSSVDKNGNWGSALPRAEANSADDFSVVDCLLPGQIRRLGGMTYVGKRKPLKTTVNECEVRGGEYVLDAPASYKSALRIWQDSAEQGDPEAQYYTGEIYEKGLAGGQPDYLLAAAWYRKAAQQGYKRAAVNLARLYEQGLGVARDPAEALRLYQQAAGLDPNNLAFLIDQDSSTRIQQLTGTLQQRDREIEQLQRQLQQLQTEISNLQQQLQESRSNVEQLRATRDDTRLQVELRRLQLKALDSENARQELENKLQQQEQALAQSNANIARLQNQLATLYSESANKQKEISQLNQAIATGNTQLSEQLQQRQQQIARLQQQLQATTSELATAQQTLQAKQQLTEIYRGRVDELKQLQAKPDQQAELQRYRQELTNSEARLVQQNAKLQQRSQLIADLQQRIAQLQADSEAQQQQLRAGLDASDSGSSALGPPLIDLIDPPLTVSGGVIRLSLPEAERQQISGRVIAPAGLKSLTINGQPVATSADGRFKTQLPKYRSRATDITVQIAAIDNRNQQAMLQIIVTTGAGLARGPLTVSQPSIDKEFGRYYALVIGNDKYRYWQPLDNAVNDARAVARLLRDNYDYEVTERYNAERATILSTINDLRKQLTEKDNLLIYYAGHGHLVKELDEGYWIPVDAKQDDDTEWISTRNITGQLKIMSAKHVLVVADSCYAGTLTRGSLSRLKPGISDSKRMQLLQAFASSRVRTALTSGGVQPVLDSGGSGHSVFTKAFLDVLQENGLILETERLFLAIRERVSSTAFDMNVRQIPTYEPIHMAGHEAGDFVFVPR